LRIERVGLDTFPRAMGMGRLLGALGVAGLLALTGCGGGERQDANEPEGTFDLSVVDAKFPLRQHIAQQSRMRISVRNGGDKAVPNVAVTVKGFGRRSPQQGLADPNKPIWIVDEGPKGGDTAYVQTWAVGSLGPGRTRTLEWKVTPTMPGRYEVSYEVAAGLDGKAKTRSRQHGSFNVDVSGKAPQATVDPDTGQVIRGDQSE
jgi:hypothetical protein